MKGYGDLETEAERFDLFCATSWPVEVTKELRNSLLKTERLDILLDADEFFLETYIKSLLFDAGLFEVAVNVQ